MQLYSTYIFKFSLILCVLFEFVKHLADYIKELLTGFKELDDCYIVWRSSQISLEDLLLTLTSINFSIRFTVEYSKDKISFL